MRLNLDTANVATILVLMFAVVGGALVIISAVGHVDPELRLTFKSYLNAMVIAAGGLAVGRGLSSSKGRT